MVYKSLMKIAASNDTTLSPALYTSNVTGASPPPAPTVVAAEPSTTTTPGAATEPPSSAATKLTVPTQALERPSPQYARAYKMWYRDGKSLDVMCAELSTRGDPLKESTVM